jgi:hypothetical protein
VSDKSAVQRPAAEHDTLPTLERVFQREQREAPLAPAGPAPSHALRDTEFEDDADDRDTEPSIDALLLREALLAVGNNHGQ